MGKKIIIPEDEVKEIIRLYVDENIGTPTLSKKFGYHKSIISRTLKENDVTIDTPGRRYLGGKKVSDAKYYKKNKKQILDRYSKWSKENRDKLRNYHSEWREKNRENPIEFDECWSLSNLQPLWGKDNLIKNNKIVAHQYKIRQEKKEIEKDDLPFKEGDVKIKNSIVRQINRKDCEEVINEYEWLGYLPKYTKYHFGIFFNVNGKEYLGGVVAYQPEYGNNIGVWDKYGFTDKIIQLSRGVCLWWTPKNTASFMISKTLKWLTKETNYEIVSATVDSKAGEIGTIYQSLGWHYIGCMDGNKTKSGKERIRYGYKINGKIYNQRHIRSMIGTAKRDVVLEKFPGVEIVNLGRKKRYFKFIKKHGKHYNNIKDMIKDYPKR